MYKFAFEVDKICAKIYSGAKYPYGSKRLVIIDVFFIVDNLGFIDKKIEKFFLKPYCG